MSFVFLHTQSHKTKPCLSKDFVKVQQVNPVLGKGGELKQSCKWTAGITQKIVDNPTETETK